MQPPALWIEFRRRCPLFRTSRSLRNLGLLAGAGALLFGASGCAVKREDNANLIVGKQQFVAKCGSCHTLARAGTKGIVGPNLDEAFRQSLAEGLKRSTIEGVVSGQVLNPNREGVMPKGLAGGTTLSDIAAYVAQSADRPGQDTGLLASAVEAPGAGKPAVEQARQAPDTRKPQRATRLRDRQGDRKTRTGHRRNAELLGRLAQHRDRRRRARREPPAERYSVRARSSLRAAPQ